MVTSDQRRRQLAREKFERQQQRRQQSRKRKQRNTVIAAALAVVVAAGAAAFASVGLSDGDTKSDASSAGDSQSPSAAPSQSESAAPEPAMSIDKKAKYSMSLKTSGGDIAIAMDAAKTPHTVNSFKSLADKGFFNGTKCHRLTTEGIFVLQCGDPKGDGTGGPGYTIPDENLTALGKAGADGTVTFPAGTVAMANTGQPHTGGSQFFLVYKETKLPPGYTPFGTMDAAGLKAVQDVAKAGVAGGAKDGAPKTAVTMEKASVSKV
ncbi:peptidylprolyl isomerase [Streptomyces lunaelactis]|uniref:peptidylprolyl isomerase n=1 Tax=Streptomyces lunaelactis TaxID=1535768 RepID=UPI001585A1F7|nr:peptidylprolyl isomerase [Streptomyces lunaelactis]NUK01809.1 peptidylprolyl isomerase [Streptomyces lunaelactis]NUK15228.1 peptidylprolyl isomerase [Streptomyces lunaelactis]NUK22949.1 peptidylprolyl isomerase [Streptomyces lunaelactis]NUK33058.1 peptidylprolyl isomerase [Streptomyces lunaelactis]NUK40289.1 peptidylprolyl isomerase [Streptomyces lunaelactis]